MDEIRKEINKIKLNKNKRKEFFEYCNNELNKSPENIMSYYTKFIEDPLSLPHDEIVKIFDFFDLNKEVLNVKVNKKDITDLINQILIILIEIEKYGYSKDVNEIMIKLLEIKNKEGVKQDEL